ncbi:hypothetical protein KCP76_15855 [Salmonella enterica subsp. enterica serovar Weltevreden]|nr:hypothetical protein KCP76_15855 [Salmonella enterica subsp. enterica serovar Weltevreden]
MQSASRARGRRDGDPNPQVAGVGCTPATGGYCGQPRVNDEEAEALNKCCFLKRMRTDSLYIRLTGRPWDGRTAILNGESQWITSPQARRDVQRLRARKVTLSNQ